MKKIILVATALLINGVAISSPLSNTSKSLWQDIKASSDSANALNSKALLKKQAKNILHSRSLILDESNLKKLLPPLKSKAKTSHRYVKSNTDNVINNKISIELPLPNGRFVLVQVIPSPILSQKVAEQHPEIQTWRVIGIDNPAITGRLDFTSKGFHGMLNMPDGDTVFIDPEEKSNLSSAIYHSLSKHENSWRFKQKFNCKVHEKHSLLNNANNKKLASRKLAQKPALDLITYRLVIAGTAEYTESQGGTTKDAFSSVVTTINRVNDIYQRDIGVKLQLVSGEDFIYTNAYYDPYTNDDARELVSENIANINNNYGTSRFDIAHVFAQGELGGLSYVGAACQDDYKAGGATGTPDPSGEIFSIEFVAHEIGHQLGATHSFNSNQKGCGGGNRTEETAVEPGSGSTIMSYVGLCGSDDLQRDSDALFHWINITQIHDYTRNEAGNKCGKRESTGTQNPVANAGSNSIIPINTPFYLDGSSTGGKLYSWDEIDAGHVSSVDIDTGDNAIIRTLPLSNTEDRYIPRLSDLFSGKKTKGEILPQKARELNFSFVVRDGKGGIDSDVKEIQVRNTGYAFNVLSQENAQDLSVKESIKVEWNVAATDSSPINCKTVDIQLLRESGVKNMLLENTKNDGLQQVVIPEKTPNMTNARIMVACHSQSFFQISKGAISIKNTIPTKNTEGTTEPIKNTIPTKNTKGTTDSKNSTQSSGGSTGYLFLTLALFTLRKKKNI